MSALPRIAFAHYSRAGDIGGVTTWLLRLTSNLQQQGFAVSVHLLHEDLSDPSDSSLARSLNQAGITTSCVAKQSSIVEDVGNTLNFLNNWQPTVFLPQCLPAHFIAAAIAGRKGLPWALTVHSDDPQYWSILHVIRPPRHGGRTVCVSPYLAGEVQRLRFDNDPHIIPCGVLAPERCTIYPHDRFQVAFIGRVEEYQKRISLVLESLIKACVKNPRISATIIGGGASLEDCRQKVEDSSLEGAIHFTGRVDASRVTDMLPEFQAIVLMSDFEGLPVALLEAMAHGVVPVARLIPSGIPDVVLHEQTGLLVSDEPSEAAEAILRLASDSQLWHQCSHGCQEMIKRKYLLSQTTSLWRDLINSLATQSTSTYPIKYFLLPVMASITGKRIHSKWKSLAHPQNRARCLDTSVAMIKYRIKQVMSMAVNH
jgi:colanic acid/amylovoran biosynthesis glycosyltransferase